MDTKEISYSELAKRVGDCVMNNELHSQLGNEHEFELFTGSDDYCYEHESKEDCQKDEDKCRYESIDVYQEYVISESGAEYLKRNTDEIVYYCEALKDLWKYFKGELKPFTTRKELKEYLKNIDADNWDNVFWTAGFIRGLEIARDITNPHN